ncbi:MAG: tRNA uridine-5-carboxymethylaminomethyl(34) synthesis GTPase MnmE [Lachnospiraceae bacterium]|nr:tRNA uridine-5-carboxymethylaminomethyl(34) synthesis GTPase MnmE [Lachnospiraceae bacterium]
MNNDTIAAVASGMTASGIGIIRISGSEAFSVLSRVFRPGRKADVKEYKANTIHYGHVVRIYEGREEVIDECLVSIMRAPHSYTAEDTAEINTHGGPHVMQRVLDLVLENGARAAEPGEFTKRAFLNGRMDLTEAEAVMDLIRAKSDDAAANSVSQLGGSLHRKIAALRDNIIYETARIESAIDDPEHYDLAGYGDELSERLTSLCAELREMTDSFREGRLVRDGILTVILGKPNAGKSSLLNMLTGEDRAIVTDIEGTTRDILEEQVRLGGMILRVIDTAGIRDARDKIEQIGIMRAKEYADRADLILAMFDSARPLDENDRDIINLIAGKRAVILLNKSDLDTVVTEKSFGDLHEGEDIPIVSISAKEGSGLKDLENVIRGLFFSGRVRLNEEVMITNARHLGAMEEAIRSLELVQKSIREGMPEDFYSIDLMDAYARLGEIIGEEVEDDLVDTIFSKFCMGK